MSVFISHAKTDKALVDKFVDLLQTGLDIGHKKIFCTSLEGLGIPRGQNFVSFIREKMVGAEFVIMLITPQYYESAFCMCELGATWITGQDALPILVPPMCYTNLKAVLHGVQSGAIDNKDVLNELKDRLTAAGLASAATGRWEAKRDEFINAFPRIQKELTGPTVVPVSEHETVKQAYEAAQAIIGEKETKIEELKELVEKLKECKDRSEVSAVMHKASGVEERFKQLIGEFKSQRHELPWVAVEAMYYDCRKEEWYPKTGFGTQDTWDDIHLAEERGLVTVSREMEKVEPNENHPKIRKALTKLQQIMHFMSEEAGADFSREFEEENDYPFDITNRDFWREQLGP